MIAAGHEDADQNQRQQTTGQRKPATSAMKRIRKSFELKLKPFGNRLIGSLMGHGLTRVDEYERDADK